jgi:hypothetical protein
MWKKKRSCVLAAAVEADSNHVGVIGLPPAL